MSTHRSGSRRGGGGDRPLVLGIVLLLILGLVAGGTGVTGVAAFATLKTLESDLPDPARLEGLAFAQPTRIYDRSGTVELARFQREYRTVVSYDAIPRLVLDVTVAAEDRTFWRNDGYDPAAIAAAIAQNADGEPVRGASTITQQLVRARLLPDDVVAPGSDRYLRKVKEILQSIRLTDAFPGEEGKQRIITAYLNDIYYGHQAYGIKAAARVYFGIEDLADLTPAQAAVLAGLPKSPTSLDLYRWAVRTEDGSLVVPLDTPPAERRDWILHGLQFGRWTRLSPAELRTALREPIVLSGDRPIVFRAPHFSWQVRRELEEIVGGPEAVETSGYRVVTTLDWKLQQTAEKWITAAAIAPNLKRRSGDRLLKQLRINSKTDRAWIARLRGRDINNGSLVAIDYRTGDVIAYVGSAGYYRDDLASRRFDPKYDVAGTGFRQPGSAWKPIVYATAFERRALTPGSLLLDVTTEFGRDWVPRDADRRERGPVLVRKALQYSLNIPAIRALGRVGPEALAEQSAKLGISFPAGDRSILEAGLAGAIGTVEVRQLDLVSAYGTFANGGVRVPPRKILEVVAPDGTVVYRAGQARGEQVLSPGTAWLMADILKGNTDPDENILWGPALEIRNGPKNQRRVAAVKTGTTNDVRDLSMYGFLAPPKDPAQPALALGVWMGNSDHSQPRLGNDPVFASDGPGRVWTAFVREVTRKQAVTDFARPNEVVQATIDAWSGGEPGRWTRKRAKEWFLKGTEPGSRREIDKPGLLYTVQCGSWRVDPAAAEVGPRRWVEAVADWARRARGGAGRRGEHDTTTAYFWGERSFGGTIVGPCPRPKPTPTKRPPSEPPPGQSPSPPPGPPGPPDPPGPPGGGGGGGAPTP